MADLGTASFEQQFSLSLVADRTANGKVVQALKTISVQAAADDSASLRPLGTAQGLKQSGPQGRIPAGDFCPTRLRRLSAALGCERL